MRLLSRIPGILEEGDNINQSLNIILEEVCGFQGWPVGHIYELEGDSKQLQPTDIWYFNQVTTSTKAFRKERKLLSNKTLFESDINPTFQCLSENYIDGATAKLHTCFFDIEVDFDSARGYADPSNPFAKITAITLGLDWIDKLVTLCLAPKTLNKTQAEEICNKFEDTILCNSEEEMLDHFIALMELRRF